MPNSSKGNSAIHADLLNYPSDSWQWEIIADTGGEKAYNLWYISLSQLERQFIHQFDSVRNGYNIVEGSPVNYSQTLDEPYLSWGIKTFHRSEMQQVIYNAIERQQLEEQRQRDVSYLQRFGVTYGEYERIIARHGSWDAYQAREADRTGCLIVFIILLLLVILGLASGC